MNGIIYVTETSCLCSQPFCRQFKWNLQNSIRYIIEGKRLERMYIEMYVVNVCLTFICSIICKYVFLYKASSDLELIFQTLVSLTEDKICRAIL